jgi:hypothetical protein
MPPAALPGAKLLKRLTNRFLNPGTQGARKKKMQNANKKGAVMSPEAWGPKRCGNQLSRWLTYRPELGF